jgi:hypothetical protein
LQLYKKAASLLMMKIKKEEIITQVGKIKLFDRVGEELVIGFSENGEEVYTLEVGEEGSAIPYKEALEMLE